MGFYCLFFRSTSSLRVLHDLNGNNSKNTLTHCYSSRGGDRNITDLQLATSYFCFQHWAELHPHILIFWSQFSTPWTINMLYVCHVSAIVLKWFSLFVQTSQTNACKTVEDVIFLRQSLHSSMMTLQFGDFYHWMVKMKILPVHILLFKANCHHSEGGERVPPWVSVCLGSLKFCESCLSCMCYLTWCCSSRKHVISLLNLTNPLSDCSQKVCMQLGFIYYKQPKITY